VPHSIGNKWQRFNGGHCAIKISTAVIGNDDSVYAAVGCEFCILNTQNTFYDERPLP